MYKNEKYKRREDFKRRYEYEQGKRFPHKIDYIFAKFLECTDDDGKNHTCYVVKTDNCEYRFYDYATLDEIETNSFRDCKETLTHVRGNPDYRLYKAPTKGRKYISTFLDYEMYKYIGNYGIGFKAYIRQPDFPWTPLIYYYIKEVKK